MTRQSAGRASARLRGGSQTRAKGGLKPALLAAWEHTLRRHGARRAIVEAATGRTGTFRAIDEGAAAWLRAQQVDPAALAGRAVVLALPNGMQWLEIFVALMRARAVVVPLDAAEPVAAQRRIAATLRAGFWWDGRQLVALPNPRRFRDPSTCLIKLTSGTTGEPRPLVFTEAQMVADARQVCATMGITSRDLNYALIPFGHSYGLGNLTIPLLALGVPLVCGAAALPQAIAEDCERWQPTVLPSVPVVFRALVASGIAPSALRSLRRAISAGAPLPPEVARAFAERFGRRIHAFYGSSETGGIAYDRSGAETRRGGVGRPLQGVTIAPRRGQRIQISSAAVFTLGNARRRGRHGAWVPADLVAFDARGNLTLLGRRGSIVKLAGRRVNLGEVAARLRRVAGVRDVWVGVSTGTEPVLGAALATERGALDIRTELLADTAAWKIPKKWAVLREFPVTARGKLDARALQRAVFGGSVADEATRRLDRE